MKKLKMHTPNKADENFKKLAALFPNAVTETIDENGVVVRAIDKDVLMQEISTTVVEGKDERYQFTWPDKKKSVLLANAPISKTLRPCPEESMGRDGTPGGFDSENLYIEGDNLEVLKLLQETYLGKVKMIYIDPPYNTGNDFVYEDDFAQSTEEYLANSGQYDEEGNRLVTNTESNGRFHTDWLNMIYPRLKLAKDLLSDDGIVCIQIDDNEISNLEKLCDEIFGSENLLSKVCVKMSHLSGMKMAHKEKKIPKIKEYILFYCKNIALATIKTVYIKGSWDNVLSRYSGFIENYEKDVSLWYRVSLTQKIKDLGLNEKEAEKFKLSNADRIFRTAVNDSFKHFKRDDKFYKVETSTGLQKLVYNKEEVIFASNKLIQFSDGLFPAEYIGDIWTDIGINNLHNEGDINFPNGKKPLKLLNRLLCMFSDDDSIILDFFSGSATTAHAVMQLNAEDGGNRKFIMVQVPELTAEKSEAYKAGYKTICEIGKERIRRASAKIKEENPMGTMDLDVGFRVLKCDTSNMKDVYYTPDEYTSDMFDILTDNIKEDRTPQDLLFQVMLDMGVLLSSKIEQADIAGKKVFNVADNFLIACFDDDVTEETITAIAKQKPHYFVMRDSSLANDSVATNFDQIFATYSPDTIRKVL